LCAALAGARRHERVRDSTRPVPALALTIKTEAASAVHLTYDPDRPIEQSAVTVLDQGSVRGSWSFEDVVKDGFVFLLLYVRAQRRWPAELRAPCAGRTKTDEAS
jgi:hypothetical protein